MDYNGWKNWETWTCCLFATNEEWAYAIAVKCKSWTEFIRRMSYMGITHNDDGVHLASKKVSRRELTEMIRECR